MDKEIKVNFQNYSSSPTWIIDEAVGVVQGAGDQSHQYQLRGIVRVGAATPSGTLGQRG
jgi:hypothetical protein